ncbi:ParB/RepB/Spo0J family partition protein [Duganella sp. FT94W]|uniref:ParB/RepB/Spo0J family partition protein n=1 Tax=Duganella lactea TaxID=2692173 RepID=A0ABW9VF70_9BURK|nr:ParB/RepB/Spo0J family partition protein [Duganella lactea]MYM37238.1 ParB/RepB/Spo0J family partition protein [Duganella lactea]
MSKLVVLPPPVAPAPTDQVLIVDELLLDGYRDIPTHLVRISYTNRTRFNFEALQQLSENIAEVGILQPILMRPVTPTADAPQIFEIVAGERRFRAACMAGLPAVPASVKTLTDKQAAEIQLLENIQRENPHPLEEAIGFEQLMLKHGYNADQLAAKVKQSRSYVYGRLKLCALSIKARELFLDDIKRFPASTALLIARIPTPQLQDKALDEIMAPQYNGEPMSVRLAATHISGRYTLALESAPFDVKDAKLLSAAGNCTKCPKRTGNQPEVYADTKSADVCTDPDCFAEKKAAHYQRIIVIANKKGLPILEGEAARAEISHSWNRDCDFVTAAQHLSTFERVAPSTGMAGTVSKYLSPNQLPAPVKYRKNSDGTIDEVFRRTDIQAALEEFGACETESARAARVAEEASDPKLSAAAEKKQNEELAAQKQRDANKERAATITAERTALYRKLRSRVAAGFSLHIMRELAKLLIRDHCNEYSLPDDLIGDLYSFERSDDSACAYIDQADASEVQMLILDTILGDALSVHPHYLDEEPSELEDAFLSMVKLEGIDASAAEIAIERIDPTLLTNPTDVLEVIEANIEHLGEVAAFIIDRAPHHLGNVEAAANKLGYFHTVDGWTKKEEASEAKPERGTLKLKTKQKDHSEATPVDGPVITVKKTRSASVPLSPAATWPFPTGSKQSM